MIIYLEKQAKNYPIVKKILEKNKKAQVIEILNYKNIFDKNIWENITEKCLILAKLNSSAITKAPEKYWHNWNSFFFKTSLNCVFDCNYCFLKWAFKNDFSVIFVNYEDIKNEIKNKIIEVKKENWEKKEDIWFYSSDYSDIQGFDYLTNFNEEFIPFFEKFDWVMMETRTKSWDINSLLRLKNIPKNTEIAFSLNPQILIEKYEKKTASLNARINALNSLIEKNFKVWIRFLPLLPVENYYEIYSDFIEELKEKIDFSKINSSFVWGLLYTKEDYKKILKKNPELDILYKLEDSWDWFFREKRKIRDNFYKLFKKFDEKCMICLDF